MKKIFTLVLAALASQAFAFIDTLPESAQTATWYFNAQIQYPAENVINKEIQVAFDGNDFYFAGIDANFARVWVKGTLEDGVYVFPEGQDVGTLWGSYAMNFSGYDYDSWVATAALAQMQDDVLTFSTGMAILYTDYSDSSPMVGWVAGATMSAEPVEYVEPILTEQTADMPYKNNFDSEAKRDQVAIYSPDNSGWDWGADWETNNWYALCNNDGWEQANDYLIFPGLPLEAGKAYTVHFDAVSSSSSYWQYFDVVMGTEAKLSKLTTAIIPNGQCYSAQWQNVEQEFSVEEAGTYYIAIHCTSYAYNGYLSIDNFVVEEVDMDKPAIAESLNVTPGSNGALNATVIFTMPSANIAGTAYEADKSLDYTVTRGDIIVAQGSDKPGNMVFVADAGEGLTNGFATYKVVITDGSHVSKEAQTTVYIGIDYPAETSYLEATAEGNTVTIAWVPVTVGQNGGYVGAKYNVYACSAKYVRGEKLNDEPLTQNVFTFDYDVESGEQGEAWFCVTVVNEVDESYGAFTSIAVGAPYELPFADSFVDDSHVWEFAGEQGSAYMDRWGSFSSDGDDASLCFYIWGWEPTECSASATSGKIRPEASAQLSVDYLAQTNAELTIALILGEELIPVADYTLEAGTDGTLVLPGLFDNVLDQSSVRLAFVTKLEAAYEYFFLDNLQLEVVETVGITELPVQATTVYSLDGRRLNARPAAGLYIQDAQKVLVR